MQPLARLLLVAQALLEVGGLSLSRVKQEPEPSPDDTGLFGPSFKIPLLQAGGDQVAADLRVRLAVTPPEQHHGLMFKSHMEADEGMLFLYTNPQQRVLWMKNTHVPLDAAWFTNDGVIREVAHLKPLDLTYRWTDRDDIVMGLELPGGFFERNRLNATTLHIDKKALSAALKSRGFDPLPYIEAGHPAAQLAAALEKDTTKSSTGFLQRRSQEHPALANPF